jgi:hypothetical protein
MSVVGILIALDLPVCLAYRGWSILWWLARAEARARRAGEACNCAGTTDPAAAASDGLIRERATTAREFAPDEIARGARTATPPPVVLAAFSHVGAASLVGFSLLWCHRRRILLLAQGTLRLNLGSGSHRCVIKNFHAIRARISTGRLNVEPNLNGGISC